jgi:exopolysaccharide biosynthesis polyprenyl glycosylphosphotransferase
MKSNASLIYNFFLVIGDFLALVAAFVGAYILRVTLDARPLIEAIPARTYLAVFLGLLPFWLVIFALLGLYNSNIYEKRFSELGRLLTGSFLGLLFVVFWSFVSRKPIFPARLVPIYGSILAFIFLVLIRNLARLIRKELFSFQLGLTNVLVIGDTLLTKEIVGSLVDSRQSGYRVLGVVGASHLAQDYPGLQMFETFTKATEALGGDQIHSIIQTELYKDEQKNQDILGFAQSHHAGFRFTPGNSELFVGKIDVELFRSSIPVIAVHQTALFGWGRLVKRVFDLIGASVLLIVTSPLMLVIALFVKLEDGGPVFLRQTRLTRFNREFRVFKFRTNNVTYNGLTPDEAFAKMKRPDLLKQFRDNGNFLVDDPRNTKIGIFLRRTSLDELAQLFNVISGDLSLVGPRALIPKDLAEYEKRHTILSVKSGITGLAQVSGRNNIPIDERRKLDIYYAQNWSFWLDIVILLKTLRVVVTSEDRDKAVSYK